MKKIYYLDAAAIKNKTVLLRADFDVAFDHNHEIADDVRIKQNIPTIKHLLKGNNRIICIAKLGRPKHRDPQFSLQKVVNRLQQYLFAIDVHLINDFRTEQKKTFTKQTSKQLLLLENIRFYPEEKQNDSAFAKQLANLGDIYINDAFAMCHRTESSIVTLPTLLPSYAGLLLKKEIAAIEQALFKPKRPLVAIIGGAKIATKINLIKSLLQKADTVVIGGGLANVFLKAQGIPIGGSLCEDDMIETARELLYAAAQQKSSLLLPKDFLVGDPKDTQKAGICKKAGDVLTAKQAVLDIGPETKASLGKILEQAKTIIWNGPVGLCENPSYRQGTDFLYYAITQNAAAVSIVGGGDTLAAINNKDYLDRITHISTGGGAMLELIEKGTLPGIEAIKR